MLQRLQEIVVSEQLQRYCEAVRPCPRCHRRRHLKDYRCRRFDTVFGRLGVRAPRFDGCRHCGEQLIASPVSELLPERVSPELRHLQAEDGVGCQAMAAKSGLHRSSRAVLH